MMTLMDGIMITDATTSPFFSSCILLAGEQTKYSIVCDLLLFSSCKINSMSNRGDVKLSHHLVNVYMDRRSIVIHGLVMLNAQKCLHSKQNRSFRNDENDLLIAKYEWARDFFFMLAVTVSLKLFPFCYGPYMFSKMKIYRREEEEGRKKNFIKRTVYVDNILISL